MYTRTISMMCLVHFLDELEFFISLSRSFKNGGDEGGVLCTLAPNCTSWACTSVCVSEIQRDYTGDETSMEI